MDKEKSLVKIEKEGIFTKIKRAIFNIFRKNELKSNEPENIVNTEKQNFKENIVVERDLEKERIEKLQQDFENGIIKEEEISLEDTILLHELYDNQIEELNKKIEQVKNKIIMARKKLKVG